MRAWIAEDPVLGSMKGIVVGVPTILVADLALILIYALELFTPLTEEEHFLVAATMLVGEVAIPVIHIGRWLIGALAPLFAKRPRLAWKILPRIKEVVRAVFQKLAGRLEKKSAAGAKAAPVDPFAKTDPVGTKGWVDPYARTEPGQPALVESVTHGKNLLPDPRPPLERQIETAATTLKADQAVVAAWGEAARYYPYWDVVEAYFRVHSLPEADREAVRLWLRVFSQSGIRFELMTKAGVPGPLQGLIGTLWYVARTGAKML